MIPKVLIINGHSQALARELAEAAKSVSAGDTAYITADSDEGGSIEFQFAIDDREFEPADTLYVEDGS